VRAWQERPLETHYPFVWLDAIHYKVRTDGYYQNRAVYTVQALGMGGRKEVLGLYLSENEGARLLAERADRFAAIAGLRIF
jgi:transposase-like protein